MKQIISLCILCILAAGVTHAQDFITRGKIEYEIKRNNKRIYADRANSSLMSALPEFDISYRELIFAWNRWVYQPGRKSISVWRPVTDNAVYADLDKKETVVKKQILDGYFVYEDSLRTIKWKIENETRKIAGWECRKAVGRIYDSVYVVAFYCPEIIPQGGPEMFSGLPGMILGLAIPRYFTTWFATKIEIANIDESTIVPPVVKKSKQYTKKELAPILMKKWQETGWWKDVTEEKIIESLKNYLLD